MSSDAFDDKSSETSDNRTRNVFLARLKAAAPIVIIAGAVGSLGLLILAGRQTPPTLLLLLATWVLSPFIGLILSHLSSNRWPVPARATVHLLTTALAIVSLVFYGIVAFGPPSGRTATPFMVLPLVSWMLILFVVPLTALMTGKKIGRRHRLLKALAVLALSPVIVVTLSIGLLWLEHRSDLTLPTPTGPFAVGRMIFDWTDDGATDPMAPVAGTKREVLVWLWYPAATPQTAAGDYVPAQLRLAGEGPSDVPIWRFLTRDWAKVHTHSTDNADVSPREESYPVVVMRGGASASVMNYTTLAEDLASHGYMVVGIDAPYRTGRVVFPDGRVITRTPENDPEALAGRQDQAERLDMLFAQWTSDIGFVLDRLAQLNASDASDKLKGRLDLTRVGIFGHSFGGAQAAQFCRDDNRCKAAIDIDGAPYGSVIQTGSQKPLMFLLSDHSGESDAESREVIANIQSIYDRLPENTRVRIMIRGANHNTFSDDTALLKSRVLRGILRLFGKLRINASRQLALTAYCVHSFFDQQLKGAPDPHLGISSPLYPEIEVVK